MNKQRKSINRPPWGNFEIILGNEQCKVKKITVNPQARLSYQSHEHRSEVWVFICGEGEATINDEIISVSHGSVVSVPQGSKHRVKNTHSSDDLIFIETQLGTYFGEDDIIRYEDDYGRHQDNWADVDADLL